MSWLITTAKHMKIIQISTICRFQDWYLIYKIADFFLICVFQWLSARSLFAALIETRRLSESPVGGYIMQFGLRWLVNYIRWYLRPYTTMHRLCVYSSFLSIFRPPSLSVPIYSSHSCWHCHCLFTSDTIYLDVSVLLLSFFLSFLRFYICDLFTDWN